MWTCPFLESCLHLFYFQVPPRTPCHIWCLCPGASLVEVLHIVNLQSAARAEERCGPSHIHFHVMPLSPVPCLRLALRHLVPGPCSHPVVNGLTSPLNNFVMSDGVHHPDVPFLTEALISQLLGVSADEGLQLSSFPGIGPG